MAVDRQGPAWLFCIAFVWRFILLKWPVRSVAPEPSTSENYLALLLFPLIKLRCRKALKPILSWKSLGSATLHARQVLDTAHTSSQPTNHHYPQQRKWKRIVDINSHVAVQEVLVRGLGSNCSRLEQRHAVSKQICSIAGFLLMT